MSKQRPDADPGSAAFVVNLANLLESSGQDRQRRPNHQNLGLRTVSLQTMFSTCLLRSTLHSAGAALGLLSQKASGRQSAPSHCPGQCRCLCKSRDVQHRFECNAHDGKGTAANSGPIWSASLPRVWFERGRRWRQQNPSDGMDILHVPGRVRD